jgi:uncharacterized protein
MVMPGQILERPAVIACGDLVLDGLFHRGDRAPAVLVCPPLGAGGGMDSPAVAELAWACARAGHPSLRFQHRGVGASGGEPDPARAVDDALSALAHLAESAGVRTLAVAGVASGCETVLALARATGHLSALVLAAPERPPELAGVGSRVLVLVPEHGAPAIPAVGGSAQMEVVAGADAHFRRGLPALARAAAGFLSGST